MKYTAEMDSAAMIYVQTFINIDSGNYKLMGWDAQTDRTEIA
jgi:hypothetical protein